MEKKQKPKPDKRNPKVLFLCKKRLDEYGISFGLINSCKFIVNYLLSKGIEAKVVMVTDGNDVDRVVTNYHPTHVCIQALWVTPEKIEAWINKQKFVDLPRANHHFTIRLEVEESRPLGIATWRTTGALRNIRMLPIHP